MQRPVVSVLAEMLAPTRGRAHDSQGILGESIRFVRTHACGNENGGTAMADVSVDDQGSSRITWRVAKLNFAARSIGDQIARGDSFLTNRHPNLKADTILTEVPLNVSDWTGERVTEDQWSRDHVPAKDNTDLAWRQYVAHHPVPAKATGFMSASELMSSSQSGNAEIRENLVTSGRVGCIATWPGPVSYLMPIPACLWFVARHRSGRGEVLLIDTRNPGLLHREPTGDRIAASRGSATQGAKTHEDPPILSKGASPHRVRRPDHGLILGRCVETELPPDNGESFDLRRHQLVGKLQVQQATGMRLDAAITEDLKMPCFDVPEAGDGQSAHG